MSKCRVSPHGRLVARVPQPAGAAALLLFVGIVGGCDDPVSVSGENRRVSAGVGTEVVITLGTVRPGEFASPPEISSPSLEFVEMSYVGALPGGPTQRFRLRTVARGRAVVTFRHTFASRVVSDTVDVR
ncbi:hypothetical protein J421_5349 (plasmid) [Gemmatirosa kalamazoonensis]|jgi:hypothetical protein|uniref:Lipoprotein n=1 Tax=Gemmatirosa kalamazoonensis TaxID=861299 RepID=W0RPF0_9BACT|nr:hypothetical protein [Gemmatirosa kalamazoonensis]AHG92884.1 hypothetical protein J421_5349 [Gemmatirosa kalamazoonensis]